MRHLLRRVLGAAGSGVVLCWLCALTPAPAAEGHLRLVHGSDVVEIQVYAPNIVGIHIEPNGLSTARTLVIDPALQPQPAQALRVEQSGPVQSFSTPRISVRVQSNPFFSIAVEDSEHHLVLRVRTDTQSPIRRPGAVTSLPTVLVHDEDEKLYGIAGLPWHDDIDPGILRSSGGIVAAGFQGDGGAPFFFTQRYGVLVDSDGGNFLAINDAIRFLGGSRPDAEYFVMVGSPAQTLSALARLTGRPPMPPKWTLGFLNSQWGSTQQEWQQIAARYEREDIPVSGFILDFDWKAWGEDNYGEWRWNSTSGAGNVSPDKFPDGASGGFAREMLARDIHLVGIVKPRILLARPDGQLTQAAADATRQHFWYPAESPAVDYFSHRLARDIDFADPTARRWFWEHLAPAFRAGTAGWWNDEADQSGSVLFNNFQFLNMGRMEYDGQRSISNQRVWSINRNYYLGAARYGYAEWSGDITTGFQSMAYQRRRLIAAVNLGEPSWSMDTGGFIGHPTAENYSRWMEFAAFVPIFRVHGSYQEKRQPWVYGAVAEAAARKAIRLRYSLLPYIYSTVWQQHQTGLGLVRPLFWEFADDPCATETNAWMFGDALLVSPIVEPTPAVHSFYLPRGHWFDYDSGQAIDGGRVVSVVPDARRWQDIPLYVRAGSIVATDPAHTGNQVSAPALLQLDVFPSTKRDATFTVYDDDGETYDYEKSDYFSQQLSARRAAGETRIGIATKTGHYQTAIAVYHLRVHQAASEIQEDGRALRQIRDPAAFEVAGQAAWRSGVDRFGPVTEIRLPVDGRPHTFVLRDTHLRG